jgi:exo-beta-1,3-glucanase (GH17 family)
LLNNDGDALTVAANGAFTFATPVKKGDTYAVTIQTQPVNQTCTVAQGSGTAAAAVTSVAVTCAVTITQGQRALPAVYASGKAVGYSAYRAGGPGAGEVPSDANILQDLQLLDSAGFGLIRLLGADAASTSILRLANANHPAMSFQLGIFLENAGASCADAVNTSEINTAISLANQYVNVATVSVGNETSFAANLPMACLASYITQVRGAVAQPVTADDDYTFYAGLTSSGEKPDTILPLLDFASIHVYPFSDTNLWDWQQTATTAGVARATAMINASLVEAKALYASAANYPFSNSAGLHTTTGAAMRIVIGESDWKARPPNQSQLEKMTSPAIANSVNAKWYLDLLGTRKGSGAPAAIFYFDAFDEAWKGIDDGWGLWDSSRAARSLRHPSQQRLQRRPLQRRRLVPLARQKSPAVLEILPPRSKEHHKAKQAKIRAIASAAAPGCLGSGCRFANSLVASTYRARSSVGFACGRAVPRTIAG